MHSIDHAMRWPLYVGYAVEPMVLSLVVLGQPNVSAAGAPVLLVITVGHAFTCFVLLRAGISTFLNGTPVPWRLVGVAIAITVAGLVASLVLLPDVGRGADGDFHLGMLFGTSALLFCAGLTAALTPLLDARRLVLLVAVPAAAAGLAQSALDGQVRYVWAANYLGCAGLAALTYRPSVWLLEVVAKMESARDVQARLAVAEERLRFARDLHDVLGRNLALIAVNSDLAAELMRRGQDGAAERMLDVRRTAEESMREVREVVAGARSTDLDAELAGARSVLRSAGIRARVIGDGTHLPAEAQTALGWVVREATTNIIRHSDPTAATIELDVVQGSVGREVVLRIENDGARVPRARDGGGNGLVGLRERLRSLGGVLTAAPKEPGSFLVEVRLPLDKAKAGAPHPAGTLP